MTSQLVQHANQASQLFERNFLRRKIFFEPVTQVVQACFAVEPIQQCEFFLLEAKVIQTDGIFHNPVLPALVALLGDLQVRPHANRQRTSGTGNQTVGKRGHEKRRSISNKPACFGR